MNPSYDQLNDYSQYLQSQVEKFTAFMISQKKLNEKHMFVEDKMKQILVKINRVQQKIKVIEVNQKDCLLDLRKIKTQRQTVKTIEIRVENLQHELNSILKYDEKYSQENGSSQGSIHHQSCHRSQAAKFLKNHLNYSLQQKDLQQIQNYLSDVFVKKNEVQSFQNKTNVDFDFKIKKLQMQIDKSKQSFLKLTAHINSLSTFTNQNFNKRQTKNQNRLVTQSTKDLNMEQQNIVTKKQLRKMQKKLQTFFSQKLSQITTKNKVQNELESIPIDKSLKFRKLQQKYNRITFQNSSPKQTLSQRRIDISDQRYLSQKKLSLFDNEILRQKQIHQINNHKKIKNKHKTNIKESPISNLQSPKNSKQRKAIYNSKSQSKILGKKKSSQRLKRINVDYMMN